MSLMSRLFGGAKKAAEGEYRPGPYLLSDGWLSASAGRLMNWWQSGYSLNPYGESSAMVEACVEAFNATQDPAWLDDAVTCFNWFLGHNDLNLPLYDPKTGGCRDGLMADGINQNEGAESSLAWLLSLMTLQKLYADEILKQPVSPKSANTG